MSFKYKVRPYDNEDGEFTNYVPADKATVDQIFKSNWRGEDTSETFRTIAITDNHEQTLIIYHIKKSVFDIYFIPLDKGYHYFKKTDIQTTSKVLDLFLNDKVIELTSSLNKSKEDNDYIRNDFFNKSFDYQITDKQNRKEISWMWYALPLGVAFIVLGFININHGASGLLFVIGLILWLPGVIIHYQYYKDNSNLRVKISKGSELIEVTTPTATKTFKKADIKEVLKVDSGINRFAWGQYGFTRIEFKTGEIVNLTSLMLDQLFIEEKFEGQNIKTLKTETLIPTLNKKTRL
jgi:hypothetical protein